MTKTVRKMWDRIVNASDLGKYKIRALDYNYEDWHYVGRGQGELHRSALGNPYRAHGLPPGSTLPRYRAWLWRQIERRNRTVIAELMQISDQTVLVCHCKNSETCHSTIVRKAAAWLNSDEGTAYRTK